MRATDDYARALSKLCKGAEEKLQPITLFESLVKQVRTCVIAGCVLDLF